MTDIACPNSVGISSGSPGQGVVGASPQWGDGSDASYADVVFVGGASAVSYAAFTILPAQPGLDPTSVISSVTVTVRGKHVAAPTITNVSGLNPGIDIELYDNTTYAQVAAFHGSVGDIMTLPTDAPANLTKVLPATQSDPTALAAALHGGSQLIIRNTETAKGLGTAQDQGSEDLIYEVILTYGSTSAPQPYLAPRRLHPREDAQGIGGGRLWPPPRSRRNFGGYV